MRSRYPHGIELANDPDVAKIPLDRFTCFMHAFGLAESTVVAQIASALDRVYPNSEFVAFLADRSLERVSTEEAREGDIVLYWDDEIIAHAGRVRSGRVLSKWGAGHLWEHDVFEIPMQYGNRVTFYHPIDKPVAEKIFVEYAKQREGAALIDQLLAG